MEDGAGVHFVHVSRYLLWCAVRLQVALHTACEGIAVC